MWNFKGVTLELTQNHGTETQDDFSVNNGNVEPHRGFGHIAMMCRDVYATSEELEANGVKMQKRPNEGNMKGLAFALDPDGYWVEIIKRKEESTITQKFTFAQTMIRVKDATKSINFYGDILGLNMQNKMEMPQYKFSLFFMSHAPENSNPSDYIDPVIELTHNHGTEDDEAFKYHNGNTTDDDAK